MCAKIDYFLNFNNFLFEYSYIANYLINKTFGATVCVVQLKL